MRSNKSPINGRFQFNRNWSHRIKLIIDFHIRLRSSIQDRSIVQVMQFAQFVGKSNAGRRKAKTPVEANLKEQNSASALLLYWNTLKWDS